MKTRRELTPEQIAARDARRSKFRELSRRIAAMSEAERAQLAARLSGIVTVEGRVLSCFNACLLVFQLPHATVVGGFRQWLAHGRAVKKGEHGAAIWVPCSAASGAGKARRDGSDVELIGENPDAEAGEGSPRFIMATVFDVAQTSDVAAGDNPAEVIDLAPAMPKLEAAKADGEPFAVVAPEVADAFGMRGMPHVLVAE